MKSLKNNNNKSAKKKITVIDDVVKKEKPPKYNVINKVGSVTVVEEVSNDKNSQTSKKVDYSKLEKKIKETSKNSYTKGPVKKPQEKKEIDPNDTMPSKDDKTLDNIKKDRVLTKRGYILDKSKLPKKELIKLKNELTVQPYVSEDYGQEQNPFPLYKENKKYICVPRFYGVSNYGTPKQTIGFNSKDTEFIFKGEMREKQKPIINASLAHLRTYGGGILNLYCGCGKTVLALYIAAQLKKKTLIIVHKTFLQNQWYDRISEFTNADIGIIRRKKVDIEGKDIVVGMLQSISMIDYDLDIFDQFDTIIMDECHHMASRVFSKAMYKSGGKYVIGLSATPTRADGLTKILHWYMGDIMYKLERKGDKGVLVKVFNYHSKDKNFIERKQWIPGRGLKSSSSRMITGLKLVDNRNIFIVKIISEIRRSDERKILVLSDRIEHLTILKKLTDEAIKKEEDDGILEEDEITTAYYIGKMKDYEQKAATDADIIFASYAMAAEGLDVPDLNTLIFATPKKNIIQCVGRILRKQIKEGDLNPLIIDIVDQLSMFTYQGNARIKYFNKKKYTIDHYNAIEDSVVNKKKYTEAVYGKKHADLISDKEANKDITDLSKILTIGEVILQNDDTDSDSDSDCGSDENVENDQYMFVDI